MQPLPRSPPAGTSHSESRLQQCAAPSLDEPASARHRRTQATADRIRTSAASISASTVVILDSTDLDSFCEQTIDEVYLYALRLTGGDPTRTADLTQETYAALLRHVNRHPAEPVGVAWLITCCRHRHLDYLRGRERRERNQVRGWDRPVDTRPEPDDAVVAALSRLKAEERLVLVMRYVDGFGVSEIAVEIGKSVASTESILRRGRDRLRAHILREHEEAERS